MADSGDDALLSGRRVLVVEDQYILACDIAQALGARGAQVVGPVPNLERALSLSRTQAVDIAILDINLPGEDVYRLAEELMRKDVPIVFATGVDAGILPPIFSGVPRVEKPFRAADLIRAVARLIDRPGGRPS
ncbi:response regulator [Methylobacterium durans]|uniref:response regulator n=1 Tax=Methylobacterium durans TaxID=2202825 RepID=UPI002AFDCC15|nr:response regulator [Methylobacterium durans]MEA1834059.1 response regulator [Methylobacterium durans]